MADSSITDELIKWLDSIPEQDRLKISQIATEGTGNALWVPNEGPQREAYECEADELLYGGSAGSGKTEIGIGLALTRHHRSLLLRRFNDDARAIMDRAVEIAGHSDGLNRTIMHWRMKDRILDFGGCQLEEDKQRYKGDPHDLIFFDEGADFTQTQYEFISIWNRSAKSGQRCRIVVATNPPTTSEGLWIVKRWGAWLDPTHPKYPTPSGYIRWYLKRGDDDEEEVDGPGPYDVNGEMVRATSRTFIRGRLEDNPDLARTNYGDQLHKLPPELRSAYRDGRFDLGLEDTPNQVIPTAWILEAQKRWTQRPPTDIPMCAMGVDCSGGGKDPLIFAPRHDGWYAPLIEIPGKDLPMDSLGRFSVGQIVSHRKDGCVVVLDMGGGYGSSTYEHCVENDIPVIPYKGSEKSLGRTKDRLLGFNNKRSESIWRFREALDPDQDEGSPIMLPPDQTLLADLATPTFEPRRGEIHVEAKEHIVKRLGRSTDRGDAVVMAWTAGQSFYRDGTLEKKNRKPTVVTKRSKRR